jgi:hypothetical protein
MPARLTARRRFCHDPAAHTMLKLGTFFAPLERRAKATGEKIRVVMESTTNSRAIQRLLSQYGCEAGIDPTAEVLLA